MKRFGFGVPTSACSISAQEMAKQRGSALLQSIFGCRSLHVGGLFGAAARPHTLGSVGQQTADVPEVQGGQRKWHRVETTSNPGQAAAGADCGRDIVCCRLNVPRVAYVGFMQGGWNILLSVPSSVFWIESSKQPSFLFRKFQSGDAPQLCREKSALLHILLPACLPWAVVPTDCSS